MSALAHSKVSSLHGWLRAVSLTAGIVCLALCGAAVAILWGVERGVTNLAGGIVGRAAPAAELMRSANEVALKVGVFTRTRAESDRKAADTEFKRAFRTFGETRVALAAREEGIETAALVRTAIPKLIAWRQAFEHTATYFSQSERSTRGIAAQSSLLMTLCTQLVTDDGTQIPGTRAPTHRKTFEMSVGAIGDIQNAVLFASSLLDPAQLDRAMVSHQKLTTSIAAVQAATAPSDLKEFIDDVASRIKDLGDELTSLRGAITNRNEAQEQVVTAGNATLALIDPVVRQIMQHTLTTAEASSKRLRLIVGVLGAAAILVPIVGLFTGRILSGRINRRLAPITQRLSQAAGNTTTSTAQAEGDASALAATAEEQSAAIEVLGANANAVAQATHTNLEHMHEATRLTAHASERAANGTVSVAGMNSAMTDIAANSRRIQETVSTINEIAFQTNLLALNAAIEAARAGESGRSFGVVAEEVRRLAQRCATAAQETAEVVGQAQATTARGVEAASRVERDFASITKDINEVRTLVDKTATGSNQQTSEVEAMTSALKELRAGTMNLATQATRGAEFASNLHEHAMQLESDANELTTFLSVKGSTAAQTLPAALAGQESQPGAANPLAV